MKKTILFLLASILFMSHDQSSGYSPVLMYRKDLLKSITSVATQSMINTGKIYFKDSVIYIVEKYKGFHVIDNRNPASPVNTGFVTVPGVVDIAMKGTVMYADNATDLVAIEMSQFPQVSEISRVEKVFTELYPPGYTYLPEEFTASHRPENTVIVGWSDNQ